MDELNISSKFMRGLVSKILKSMIYKKLGYKVDLNIDELNVKITDKTAVIVFGACAEMSIDEFKKVTRLVDSREEQSL